MSAVDRKMPRVDSDHFVGGYDPYSGQTLTNRTSPQNLNFRKNQTLKPEACFSQFCRKSGCLCGKCWISVNFHFVTAIHTGEVANFRQIPEFFRFLGVRFAGACFFRGAFFRDARKVSLGRFSEISMKFVNCNQSRNHDEI